MKVLNTEITPFGLVPFILACVATAWAPAAPAQSEFIYVDSVGMVHSTKSPNTGKLHLSGQLSVATADYARGVFDGVTKDLDDFAILPTLRVTFELPVAAGGLLRDLSLTLGTDNGLTTDVDQPSDGDSWYESNNFVGLGARLKNDWLAALTYETYSSPNNIVSATTHQMALAVKHAGPLKPFAKVEVSLDGSSDGVFTKLGVAPSLKLRQQSRHPLTLKFPVALGAGLNDYYGPGTDTAGYFSFGVTGSTPLKAISSDYGSWTLSAGLNVLVRDDELSEVGPPVASDDSIVPIGSVQVSFVY